MYINISKVDFGRCYSGSGGGGEVVDLDYMTLSALGDGEITITIPAEIKSTQATSFSYSKDKSKWTDTIVDNTAKTISIPIKSGDNVYFKGDALTWFDEESYGGLSINSTANIDASGNIMSLLYGDNFTDKTTLPVGYNFNFSSLFSGNEHLINAKDLLLPATELNYNCYYSMFDGCTSLTTAPQLPATTLAESCYENMFSACSSLATAPELNATTLDAHCYFSMFSDCTSLTTAPALPATTLAMSCYAYMFSCCTSLTTAPQLPATALVNSCYNCMFSGCTSLTTAPQLPATALVNSCYFRMFYECSSLNNITMLATDISSTDCLTDWVNGVASTGTFTKSPEMTSLPTGVNGVPTGWTVLDDTDYMTLSALGNGEITITIPAAINSSYASYLSYSKDKLSWSVAIVDDTDQTITIPVTTGEDVYLRGEAKQLGKYNSFININSSVDINASGNIMSLLYGDDYKDKVAFKSGSEYTFNSLFSGNAHLINAKDLILPATTLASCCYTNMFNGCTSLTNAPELHATTLSGDCYRYMFQGCTSLTTAPELPATELADYCYDSMFKGCTKLTTAPELPATTLTSGCYGFMFEGCTSLSTAPELPATTLTFSCYSSMFYGCSNLNSITMLATDISASGCLLTWVYGVASTGTFTKAASMTSLPSGDSGIPEGWTVADYTDYMTLSALGDGEITITIPAAINSTYATSLSYSKDKSAWTDTIIDDTAQTITIPVTSGDNVYLKGIAKQLGNDSTGVNINSTANINASGNIMSLLYGDDYKDKVAFKSGSQNTFAYLFRNNTHLINADELILPATTLAYSCYSNMFNYCNSLTTAPELPATALASYCYDSMFSGCSSLTTAPALPATTLAQACYYSMFISCTSLTTAPELPATTLAHACYNYMFQSCTSLTTAPELPATTLTPYCYQYMFNRCSSLNSITMLATDISASGCLNSWVDGVASTGTFTKAAEMTSLPTGTNGIPSGWTVKNYGDVDYSQEYMTLSALGDGEITITIPAKVDSSYATSLSYSKDKSTWNETIIDNTAQTITIPVTSGENVYLKGIAKQFAVGVTKFTTINSTTEINASGNIMSLLYGDDYKDKVAFPEGSSTTFGKLFSGNAHLINAENLILPATTLKDDCYSNMFKGCSSLTTAPELPATNLRSMSYYNMFSGCSSLNSITMLATNISAYSCLSGWVNGVASTGTFTKAAEMTTLPTGVNGIPEGWTVVDYGAA